MVRTILVISDTHGYHTNLQKVLELERGRYEEVFHLGDVCDGEEWIRKMSGCPVTFVRGNCDGFSRLPQEADFVRWGHHFLLTHGHRYFLYADPSDLAAEAASRGADVALYGHTHKPFISMIGDVLTANPGSISRPRQQGHLPSYIMMHVDEEGSVDCELKFLNDQQT